VERDHEAPLAGERERRHQGKEGCPTHARTLSLLAV